MFLSYGPYIMMTYQWWCFVSSYFTVIEFNNIELQKQVIWRVINADNLIDQKSIDYVSFSRWSWTPRLWNRLAVCHVSNRPSADYHSLSRSIIGQLSVRLWVDYRSMMCRLSTDHWSIVRPQWIRIRTHDPKSLDCEVSITKNLFVSPTQNIPFSGSIPKVW